MTGHQILHKLSRVVLVCTSLFGGIVSWERRSLSRFWNYSGYVISLSRTSLSWKILRRH